MLRALADQAGQRAKSDFKNFGEFVAAVRSRHIGGESDIRLRSAGLNEYVLSEGGALVPEEFAAELRQRIYSQSLAGLCQVLPMTSSTLSVPLISESSRVNGSRYGSVRSTWLSEGSTIPTSKPKFAQAKLVAKKLASTIPLTNEMLADVPTLGSILMKIYGGEFSTMLDEAIIEGTAGRPLGILNAACMITVSKDAGQAAATFTGNNIVNMWARLLGPSRRSAVWLANEETDAVLVKTFLNTKNVAGTENTGGVPLYVPATSDDDYPRMLGRPVIVTENARALSSRGDLILADFGEGYQLGERGMRFMISSDGAGFVTDESTAKLTMRVDGAPTYDVPATPKNSTITVSPFVTLEAR